MTLKVNFLYFGIKSKTLSTIYYIIFPYNLYLIAINKLGQGKKKLWF